MRTPFVRLPASSRGPFLARPAPFSSARPVFAAVRRQLPAVSARLGGADSSVGSPQPLGNQGTQQQKNGAGNNSSSPPSSSPPLSLMSSPPPSVSANTRARLFDSPAPPSSSSSSSPRTRDPLESSFDGIMAFDGPGPELINGRLAMLGFVAGMAREVVGGVSLQQQLGDPSETGISALLLAAVLVTIASLPPLLKGVRPEDRSFAFFSWEAERFNGRVAMLAFVGVYAVEYIASVLLQ